MAFDKGTGDSTSTKPGKRTRVHIRITYPAGGDPGLVLVRRCDTLVAMLNEGDAGVIDEQGARGGSVDIFVVTLFPEHTVEVAEKAVAELGLADRSTIEIVAERAGIHGQ